MTDMLFICVNKLQINPSYNSLFLCLWFIILGIIRVIMNELLFNIVGLLLSEYFQRDRHLDAAAPFFFLQYHVFGMTEK